MLVNAVVSDLCITAKGTLPSVYDFRAMADTSSPPGYEGFRPFTPGYYDFQNALFKHIVRSKVSTPILSGLIYTVDMPDVLDKGQATVEAGMLKQVTFNKKYVKTPEIGHTTLYMAEYAVVNVTEITTDGFVFCLLNASNQRVAGTISWTSTGI